MNIFFLRGNDITNHLPQTQQVLADTLCPLLDTVPQARSCLRRLVGTQAHYEWQLLDRQQPH